MRVILALLLAGAAGFAQPAAAPGKARIAGRVLKRNAQPMGHATVQLVGNATYTATADNRGAFTIDNIEPGRYALIAQRVGYVSYKYGGSAPLARDCPGFDDVDVQSHRLVLNEDPIGPFRQCVLSAPGTMLSLSAGAALRDLAIRVEQMGVIRGKVVGEDSEILTGTVVMMQASYEKGARRLQIKSTSPIGLDNGYVADELPPGRYLVRAMVQPPDSQSTQSYASTYYPSESDASRAAPVDVNSGEETTGVDIVMRRGHAYSIRGVTSGPPGTGPVAGTAILTPKDPLLARVSFAPPSTAISRDEAAARSVAGSLGVYGGLSGPIRPDGSFEVRNIAQGAYLISCRVVQRQSPGLALYGRSEVVVAASDLEGVMLTLAPGVAVTGKVRVEGAGYQLLPTVTLAPADGSSSVAPARFGAEGAFTFPTSVEPVKYTVRLDELPAGLYVKSIRHGDQDALHAPLDLTGGAAASLDIVLSSKVASIKGMVKNAQDEAVSGVVVNIWPRTPEVAGGVKSASTDQNGNFEIPDLGPGDYFVAAWEDIDPGLVAYPEFLARFQNEAAAVALKEGGQASADLKLIPRERIASEAAKLP